MSSPISIIKGVKRICKGPPMNPETFDQAKRDMVRGLIPLSADKALRKHCGYDFNKVVLSYPFDGADHDVICPKCGVKTSFKSPIF